MRAASRMLASTTRLILDASECTQLHSFRSAPGLFSSCVRSLQFEGLRSSGSLCMPVLMTEEHIPLFIEASPGTNKWLLAQALRGPPARGSHIGVEVPSTSGAGQGAHVGLDGRPGVEVPSTAGAGKAEEATEEPHSLKPGSGTSTPDKGKERITNKPHSSQDAPKGPPPKSSPEEEEEAEDEPHSDFPQIGPQSNPWQTSLEQAEVAQAQTGSFNSTWLQLQPAAGAVGAVIAPLLRQLSSLVFAPFKRQLGSASVHIITSKVDGGFDEAEFLEGVRAACSAVISTWGSKEYELLKGMASALLVANMQMAMLAYQAANSERVVGMAADVHSVAIAGANLWSPSSVRAFDAAWAQEGRGDPNRSRSWLAVTVHITATVNVQRCTTGGEPLPAVPLHKQGSWLLLRGPLPRGFSGNVVSPWRVVGWW